MARNRDAPRKAAQRRTGIIVAGAAVLGITTLTALPSTYRLPASTILLFVLPVLRERRRCAARERSLIEAHSALAEAEASFRGVFESSPDISCVHRIAADGSVRLERFNPAAAKARGLDDSSRNKRLDEILPPDVCDAAKRAIDHVVATGQTLRREGHPGRDGPDTEIIVVPLAIDGQRADRVFVSIRDIQHLREARAAISRSEALYRALAESTSDMITRLSLPDLRRVYVSPACRKLVGYEPGELVGRSPLEDVHPADVESIETTIARFSAGGMREPLAPIAYRVRHKDGHWIWVETSTNFTCDAAGVPDGLICSIRDVDARRRAEHAKAASEARFRLLAENASELIVLGHQDGRRSYISPASTRLVGFTPNELETEMRCRRWVHPDDIDYLGNAVLANDDASTAVSCRVRRKDGDWIWVEAIFRHIPSCAEGEPTIIATFRDITERQAQAQALRDARDAADAARCAAEQASRAKADFLATMSHEIRTPLNAILGFADLLQADAALSNESKRHVDRIRNAGSTLRTVVDDILDFSRLEVGQVNLKPIVFRPEALVENALSIVRGLAEAKGLDLTLTLGANVPASVIGDHDRLRQVLINLLNNAIKFTRQGSVLLDLQSSSAIESEARLHFRVTDTGIGIPADRIEGVFQRFSQVDGSISREYGGTGLGLAICRSLVEAMGGSIGVESVVERGSTVWFQVVLPVVELAADAPIETELSPGFDLGLFDDLVSTVGLGETSPELRTEGRICDRSGPPIDILLVEDVVLNQELICAILRRKGHHIDVVGNGSEAIMAVEDKVYDLVLMDLQMPHVDGIAATRIIRNLAAPCRFVPIVALTAAVLREQTDAALEAGMNGVLTKPVSLPELQAVLEKAAHDGLRMPLDPAVLDHEVADQIVRAIGSTKVNAMRSMLKRSLAARFNAALTPSTAAELKAEAHASIAGSAMLGFVRFGSLCRSFTVAEGNAAAVAYGDLRRELEQVVRTLQKDGEDDADPRREVRVA